jgi:predicted nucleic acid-binding protein
MTYFLDTNVAMYAAGGAHRLQAPCQRIIQAAGQGHISIVVSTEVLQELLHRYVALGERQRACALVEHVADLATAILPIAHQDIIKAMEFLRRYTALTTRDAVHLATMLNHQMTEILSADQAFDAISEIHRIDPLTFRTP